MSTTTTALAVTEAPTVTAVNITDSFIEAELAEEEHEFDAVSALALNVTIIVCLLLAYVVKKFRIYALPESAGALLIGVVIGGIARMSTEELQLFEFKPEVFFFFLLPPIIFEAGYSLDRKGFFENIGAITLYAMLGTLISTFVVGILCFYAAKIGMVQGIDKENPMESLMFGALISAVDPVATLSIMGNQELGVDPLLYSLVFGESVLNDAIAICLFKTFFKYYNPDGPDWSESEVPRALASFVAVSGLSVLIGIVLGLLASWIYKHTDLRNYPNLETSLLFCFCYLCYATAEAVEMSGIMALFFQGITLSHYNSYNLSETAHVASEQIFSTFATLTETIVFVYMGMGVFTGRFQNWDVSFSLFALFTCLVGRFLNIFPLSWLANLCRSGRYVISMKMQAVLWFAGLRGAIAFALSENMPGPNKDIYATATLSICIFTTVVCGGFTERMLTVFGMKEDIALASSFRNRVHSDDDDDDDWKPNRLTFKPPTPRHEETPMDERRRRFRDGVKGLWYRFDDQVLKPHFGGSDNQEDSFFTPRRPKSSPPPSISGNGGGQYEMTALGNEDPSESNHDEDDDDDAEQKNLI